MHLIELTEAERLEYLGALIDETNAFAENTPWIDTRDQATKIEYAKSLCDLHTGLDLGMFHRAKELARGVKRTEKLGAKKAYLKYYYEGDTLTYIESYVKTLDVVFRVVFDGNIRYLVPFFKNGMPYPTYIHACKTENGKVVEEWTVEGNQIVYDSYTHFDDGSAAYYFINHVRGGKTPILMQKRGEISEALEWEEHLVTTYSYTSDTRYEYSEIDGSMTVFEWDGKEKVGAKEISFYTEKKNERLVADAMLKTRCVSFFKYKSVDISGLILPESDGVFFYWVSRVDGLLQFMKNNPHINHFAFNDASVSYLDEGFFSALPEDTILVFDGCRGLKSVKGLKGILHCILYRTKIEDEDTEPFTLCKHSVYKQKDYGLED